MGRGSKSKGRTATTYNKIVSRTKAWYAKRVEARKNWDVEKKGEIKKELKPLAFYIDRIKGVATK